MNKHNLQHLPIKTVTFIFSKLEVNFEFKPFSKNDEKKKFKKIFEEKCKKI
jgi:hypothetical protein